MMEQGMLTPKEAEVRFGRAAWALSRATWKALRRLTSWTW